MKALQEIGGRFLCQSVKLWKLRAAAIANSSLSARAMN
jgi:hypothetical protein